MVLCSHKWKVNSEHRTAAQVTVHRDNISAHVNISKYPVNAKLFQNLKEQSAISLTNQPTNQPTNRLHGAVHEKLSHSASQEIPRIIWNPTVHYQVHNDLTLGPTLSQMHQSTFCRPIFLRSILMLSTHLRLGPPSGIFPTGFPTKILYAFLISLTCAAYPAHPILLNFIILIIPGEAYKL